jgi:hypothetical protein
MRFAARAVAGGLAPTRYIETTTPAGEEEDSKRRGLLTLNQLGGR